jgi:hypothetical protein
MVSSRRVRRTIALPRAIARSLERQALEHRTSISAIVERALKDAGRCKRRSELRQIQDYWRRKALDRGILNEGDLERYLKS